MATYPQGITSFIPSYQPFQLDWNVLSRNLQLKQTKYDKNWSQLNNVYSRLYDAQVSNPESQKVKDSLLKQIDFDVRRVTGLDLSLKQNVAQAEQVFKPFYQNPNLVADIVKTSQFNTEYAKGKSFATSKNKQEKDMYWGGGLQYLNNKMEEFKSLPFDQLSSFENFNYVPYVNTDKVMREIQKEMGNVKIEQRNGGYWVTTQNGKLLEEPLQQRFRQALGANPLVLDMYNAEAYNMGQASIRQKMNENPNLSREEAERMYLNEKNKDLVDIQTQRYNKILSDKKVVQGKIDDLQQKSKNNPTKEGDESLMRYQQYLKNLENLEETYQDNLELLKGNVTKTGSVEGGSKIDPNDIKSMHYAINRNLGSSLLDNSINQTAHQMSKANYQQTIKADPYAKINYSTKKSIEAYQAKEYIKAMAETGRFPYLIRNKDGSAKYHPELDKRTIEEKKKAAKNIQKEIEKGLKDGRLEKDAKTGAVRPAQKKNFITQKPIKGVTDSKETIKSFNNQIDQFVNKNETAINEKLGDLQLMLKQAVEKNQMSEEEAFNILTAGSNSPLDKKMREEFEAGNISFEKAMAISSEGMYETNLEKEDRLKNPDMYPEETFGKSITEKRKALPNLLRDENFIKNRDAYDITAKLKKYDQWVKDNHNLSIVADNYETNTEIAGLTQDLVDRFEIRQDAAKANVKFMNEVGSLLNAYGNQIGGGAGMRSQFMIVPDYDKDGVQDPITPFRLATPEEYYRAMLKIHDSEEINSGRAFTWEGIITNAGKGAAMAGAMTAGANAIPGYGNIAYGTSVAVGAVLGVVIPAAADIAEGVYRYFADDDGTGRNSSISYANKQKTFSNEWVEGITLSGQGNTIRDEYDSFIEYIQKQLTDQKLKTPMFGTVGIEDPLALSEGTSDFTPGAPTIEYDEKMPDTENSMRFLSEIQPILKAIPDQKDEYGGWFEEDGKLIDNVSVLGVSKADFEKTEDKYENNAARLMKLMITDALALPNKNEDNKLKRLEVAISAVSQDSRNNGALVFWPNESYMDEKLKIIYPDDKDKRAAFKKDWLTNNQGLALNVPTAILKNSDMYNNQFLSSAEYLVMNAGPEGKRYNGVNPAFAITFKSMSKAKGGKIQVTKHYPVYNPYTNAYDMKNTIVDDLILGQNIDYFRDNYFTNEVPKIIYQNNQNYQQAKPFYLDK